jgi:aconitate hydratase
VYLCSPETAIAAALTGVITDPRDLDKKWKISYPRFKEPEDILIDSEMIYPPAEDRKTVKIIRGPNIQPLPKFAPLASKLEGPVLLKLENNISTDDISPAGSKALPFRSNISELSKFTFCQIDESFYKRAMETQKKGSFLVAGSNYGQGSSREHAAIAPNYLGVKAILAKSYARIHRSNLINFGILPLIFVNERDWNWIEQNDMLEISDIHNAVKSGGEVHVFNQTKNRDIRMKCPLSDHERAVMLQGGLINYMVKYGLQ